MVQFDFSTIVMYCSCLQGLTAQHSNCSIQNEHGDHTSACSEEAICPNKVSLYTSILVVLNCIKHIRNVDAVITLWLSVGDSKIIPEGTERGSPKWQEVHGLWDQYLGSNLSPFWRIHCCLNYILCKKIRIIHTLQ